MLIPVVRSVDSLISWTRRMRSAPRMMFSIAWAEISACPMVKPFVSGLGRRIVHLWLLQKEILVRVVRLLQIVLDQKLLGQPRLLAEWTLSFSLRLRELCGLDRFLLLRRLPRFLACSVHMVLLSQLEF